jgi:hypothetical protein
MFHDDIITVLSAFSPLFSINVWNYALTLLIGAILCHNQRTVAAILRVMGLSKDKHFINYYRVLNRACWSGLQASKILLGLLIMFIPVSFPIIIGIDDTIERRKGKKIKAKGCYRDAVRSSQKCVVKCFGLKWLSMMLIVQLPWSDHHWSLPFLTVLNPSESANKEANKRHKTTIDWSIQMMKQVRRWVTNRCIILIGDGGFSCIRLAHECIKAEVTLISRLRLDSRLYEFPGEQPSDKRGPKPQKGKRITKLEDLANNPTQDWKSATVNWYGQNVKHIRYLTDVNLWYKSGEKPVAVRWVLVVDPEGKFRSEAFFSTDTELSAIKIVEFLGSRGVCPENYVLRWNVDVTFEESRRHLGIETQRQWSDKAIERTTPVLFGLYSIVCLIALRLSKSKELIPQSTAWYEKQEITFSDALAYVRRHIWEGKYNKSMNNNGYVLFHINEWESLLDQLAAVA